MNDWQEMDEAPEDEPVLVCTTNCEIIVGEQNQAEFYRDNKKVKEWAWFRVGSFQYDGGRVWINDAKMWRPLPLPPKHLYERKLTADLLEKQVAELRK